MMQLLDTLKNENKVLIISKPSCYKCDEIKQHMDDIKEHYKSLDVSKMDDEYDEDPLTFVDELKNTTGCSSYPFCFYEGNYVTVESLKKKLINFTFCEDTEDF